jgi:FK506-binding protein 1
VKRNGSGKFTFLRSEFFISLYHFLLFSSFSHLPQRRDVIVEIFAAGDGINYPRKGNTVTVHYTGYLADGTRFDSSRDRNKPFKFKLGMEQVIPGLDLGVAQLSIGERAKMTIPPHLAYGERGFPGLYVPLVSSLTDYSDRIPGNSELIFDLELMTFS